MKSTLCTALLCLSMTALHPALAWAQDFSSIDVVKQFTRHLDVDHDYEKAANLLDDELFEFRSPRESFGSKEDWKNRFPKFHKQAPQFDEVMPGAHDKQVIRNGTKKVALMTIKMSETYELNDEGKIVKISAALRK